MRILISPDSFKGTLDASEVCDIIGKAFSDVIKDAKITKLPVADGGEGLCSCLYDIVGGRFIKAQVSGVFGEKMTAEYLMLENGTAVIETASCAGLPLAGENKNPEKATTKGVGELIADAEKRGAKSILLGLGGSATNDSGTGMAHALGYKFLDENGNEMFPVGGNLNEIRRIIPPERPAINIPVVAACDVTNPLYGEKGAAFVFAPQKGADKEMVERLDNGLRNVAEKIKTDLKVDAANIPGSGAAGGMGEGTIAFLGGELRRGIDIILDIVGFDEKVKEADLVITGEGQLDFQSVDGKVISGVTKRAVKYKKKVITICGCKGKGAEKAFDIGVRKMYFSTETPKPFEEIIRTCREDLYNISIKAAREI